MLALFACSGLSTPDPQPVIEPVPVPETKPDPTPEPVPEPDPEPALAERVKKAADITGEGGPWDPDWKPSSNVSQPDYPTPTIDSSMCNDIEDGGAVGGDSCVTAEIGCNQSIIGHTKGGIDKYDSVFYERKFCWPKTIDHDSGDERVYKLKVPEGEWRAFVTLYSPCADLDLFGIRHDHGGCPTIDTRINQCEASVLDGARNERVELTSQTRQGRDAEWYIVVEGKDDYEGPFELFVECWPGVGGAYGGP